MPRPTFLKSSCSDGEVSTSPGFELNMAIERAWWLVMKMSMRNVQRANWRFIFVRFASGHWRLRRIQLKRRAGSSSDVQRSGQAGQLSITCRFMASFGLRRASGGLLVNFRWTSVELLMNFGYSPFGLLRSGLDLNPVWFCFDLLRTS